MPASPAATPTSPMPSNISNTRCGASDGCTNGLTITKSKRCKIWLEHERDLVKPSTIIALGVTAARSVTGKTVTIAKMRRTPVDLADGTKLVVTVHPSALLRIEDEDDRHAGYGDFVADLKAARIAAETAAGKAAPPKR